MASSHNMLKPGWTEFVDNTKKGKDILEKELKMTEEAKEERELLKEKVIFESLLSPRLKKERVLSQEMEE